MKIIKEKLARNISLKIVSLIFSVVLWVVVVNINDPVISKRFANIPVTFTNTEVVTENNQVYEVLDNSDVISLVTITAQRSVFEGIDASDIIAVADFQSGLNEDGTVDINLSCSRYNSKISSIKGSSDSVRLNVEDKRSVQLVLKATTSGEVAEGCLIGNITTDQNLIRIEGPESVVSKIAKVSANVDVTGASSNIATYESVVITDFDGNEISNPALTTNCDQVRVSVEILGTKEIPFEFMVQGIPANGYLDTGEISSNPETVLVSGNAASLSRINSITIPETELNITGASEDMTVYVNASQYLPYGVSLATPGFDGNIAITVGIKKAETRNLTIEKKSLVAVNVPEGFEADVTIDGEEETYQVSVMGLPNAVNAIDAEKVVGYVDMNAFLYDSGFSGAEDLEPGEYDVELLFNNLGEAKIASAVKAKLTITKELGDESDVEETNN